MQYEVSFGQLGRAPKAAAPTKRFRLALLGDFSAGANAGRLETGAALARRRPIKVDAESLDDVIARLGLSLSLPVAGEDGLVTVPIAGLDDFHPDQLVENLDLFAHLTTLRRTLASRQGFERAAKEVLSWGGGPALPAAPRKSAAAAVATDHRLSDFARLTGRAAGKSPGGGEGGDAGASVQAMVRRLVGPFVAPARDGRQEQLTARVDAALAAALRRVLHHPDFQAAEAIWRGVDFLVRRIETGAGLEIVLYDVSAEEFAADLAASDALEDSGLYGMLVEQPALDAQGPLSAVIGLYTLELTPPHADLLGRMAQIAAAAGAPFVAGIGPDALKGPMDEQHELIRGAFAALQALPASAFLGLATPRFLLRLPYGRKTDPIDAFDFEEFTRQGGLGAMLWGHPALLPGLLLAQAWSRQGARMQPGAVMTAGDMPYYVYDDADGEQIALPCTERLYSERQAVRVASYRVMPLLSLRGRPEVRLGGFNSLAGTPLAGFWGAPDRPAASPVAAAVAVAEPEPASPEPAPKPASAGLTPQEPPPVEQTQALADDLGALLAGLGGAATDAPESDAAEPDELDKLLASLNAGAPAAPEATEADSTEADLDALLAALK